MYYPLNFRFKLMTFTPEIDVTDAYGGTICHVRQQFFRLKEKVEVFADDSERTLLATIEADRIIDWSAKYTFKDAQGNVLGAVGRRGMKSIWRAHYEVFPPTGGAAAFTLREENPMAKILDSFLGEIPVVGMFTGYFIHPKYLATRADGTPVMRLTKQASFLERCFTVELLGPAEEGEQAALVMSYLMMILLERARG
jgi:hypothetical protein